MCVGACLPVSIYILCCLPYNFVLLYLLVYIPYVICVHMFWIFGWLRLLRVEAPASGLELMGRACSFRTPQPTKP